MLVGRTVPWWLVAALAMSCACVPAAHVARPAPAPRTALSVQAQFDAAPNHFPVDFGPPRAEAARARARLPREFTDVAKHVGFVLHLRRVVPIHVRACGATDAYYAHETGDIVLCDELLTELLDLEPDDRSFRAAVVFIVMHEVAHALVHQLRLDVEGVAGATGETWADLFAAVMFSDVQLRIGTDSAARFFSAFARGERHDPRDPHLASEDRAAVVLCVYEGTEPGGRPACADLHRTARRRWNEWLRPFSRVQGGETF